MGEVDRGPPDEALGVVLAGGASRRMGRPKAAVALGGRPLLEAPLAAFARAGLRAVVVAKRDTPLPPVDVPVWHDLDEPVHPAAGIATALRRAGGRAVVVCACDMPFVAPGLLGWLAARAEPVVVPRLGGRMHPLLARYAPEALPALERGLASRTSMRAIVAELEPLLVDEELLARFGDPRRVLANVNDPDELARAEERAP
jgi:molybdopterin-guanine dinucleotide biosynthesis protein A